MTYTNLSRLRLPADLETALELPTDIVGQLLVLMTQASQRILHHYNNVDEVVVDRKADKSLITTADREAHMILESGLNALTPSIPVLSEESSSETIKSRKHWPCNWLVDPLDGTREFIGRTDQFTINVALIMDAKPVLGVIMLPVSGLAYIGIPAVGAWRCDDNLCWPLSVRELDFSSPLGVLASVRHCEAKVEKVLRALADTSAGVERVNAGSALKFCSLVDGEADIYPRTSPCYEWDVAAGDAIVTAAGGFVWGVDGLPMRYNQRDTLLVNRFVAGADASVDWIGKLYG